MSEHDPPAPAETDDEPWSFSMFMDLLDEAAQKGLRVRFWVCPLHAQPTKPMVTVRWDGDNATCLLCGFTRDEHKARCRAAGKAEKEAP